MSLVAPCLQRRKSPSLGFTLLEVLVAISVFSMVAIISYTTLDTYIEQRDRLSSYYGKLERIQRLFIILERDIQFMTLRKVREGGELVNALIAADGDTLISMTVAEPDFRGTTGVVLKRVEWRLDSKELIRSEWAILDRADALEPVERVISDEIEEIEVNYLIYRQGDGLENSPDVEANIPTVSKLLSASQATRRTAGCSGTALGGAVVR